MLSSGLQKYINSISLIKFKLEKALKRQSNNYICGC